MSRAAARTHRPWTAEEDATLLARRKKGEKYRVIAAELNRPLSSMASRLITLRLNRKAPPELLGAEAPKGVVGQRLGIKDGGPGEAKPRKCLCCGNTFPSAHAGNRLCYRCRNQSFSPFELRI